MTAYPQTTVIVCHLGHYLSEDEALIEAFIGLAEAHPQAYLDVSGVALSHMIEQAVARVGPKRILFGTDGPHSATDGPPYQAASIGEFASQAVGQIQGLEVSATAKRDILGGNIERLLGL